MQLLLACFKAEMWIKSNKKNCNCSKHLQSSKSYPILVLFKYNWLKLYYISPDDCLL